MLLVWLVHRHQSMAVGPLYHLRLATGDFSLTGALDKAFGSPFPPVKIGLLKPVSQSDYEDERGKQILRQIPFHPTKGD